jgi:hypothetical protein
MSHVVERQNRRRVRCLDGCYKVRTVLGVERPAAGSHLEDDSAEGEYVRSRIRFGPVQLLGRHVC